MLLKELDSSKDNFLLVLYWFEVQGQMLGLYDPANKGHENVLYGNFIEMMHLKQEHFWQQLITIVTSIENHCWPKMEN